MAQKQTTPAFRMEIKPEGTCQLVNLHGSLADDANLEAKESFLKLLNAKPARIVLDFTDLEYISSSGIGLLVSILRRCRQQGISMPVCCMKPEVFELFKLTKLTQIFEIHESLQKALNPAAQ